MRIQHNLQAMNSYRNFGVNNSKLSKNLEKLSSGYAINRAGDDAAGLAVSEKMRMQISGYDAAIKNAKDGISMIQTAEGAYNEIHDMLNRMYYLCQQADNGIYDSTDTGNIDEEIAALNEEITRINNSSKFNGQTLIGGSGTFAVDTGSNNVSFSTTPVTSGISNAKGGKGSVETAINSVSNERAKLGAIQNRLEHTVNNLNTMRENLTNAESTVRDTDMAEEMMKFTKNNIMNQAAQAMLAQANQTPQSVLQLLQ